MKFKLLVLMLLSLVVLNSCKKEEESDDSYIRATIGNDTWEATDHTSIMSHMANLNGQRYDLTAWDPNYKVLFAIAEGQLTECMSEQDYNQFPDTVIMWFYYGLGNDTFISEHSCTVLGDPTIESDVIVTVTSCSGETISGTFSGTFYKDGDLTGLDTPEVVTISNGEFKNIPYTVQEL